MVIKNDSTRALYEIKIVLVVDLLLLLFNLLLYEIERTVRFGVVFEIIRAVWTSRRTIKRRLIQVFRGDRLAMARVKWRFCRAHRRPFGTASQ
jgi:hypothetical protein